MTPTGKNFKDWITAVKNYTHKKKVQKLDSAVKNDS